MRKRRIGEEENMDENREEEVDEENVEAEKRIKKR